MSYLKRKYPRFLLPSLLVITLYFSHFSFLILEGAVYRERVSYLEENHFERTAKRQVAMEEFSKLEKNDLVGDVIKRYRPSIGRYKIAELADVICEVGENYNYDPMFLLAIIFTESSFRNKAVSRVGAMGLMQIRPFVGKYLAHETNTRWQGRKTLFDPYVNIKLGAYYLGKLYQRFDGDLKLALEAYNNGPTRVKNRIRKYGYFSSPYSQKVFNTYEKLRKNVRI